MGCTTSSHTTLTRDSQLKGKAEESTPVTAADTGRLHAEAFGSASNGATQWFPTNESWIRVNYAYSVKLFHLEKSYVVVDVCSSSEVPNTSDRVCSIFSKYDDGSDVPTERYCLVVHPNNSVVCPVSVFDNGRHKVYTEAVAAASQHLNATMGGTYEIVEPGSDMVLPSDTEVQLPPLSAFQASANGVVVSKALCRPMAPSASSSSSDATVVHSYMPHLMINATPSIDSDQSPRNLKQVSGAISTTTMDFTFENELAKYCTGTVAAYALVPRAHMNTHVLPILESQLPQQQADPRSDNTTPPAGGNCAAPVFEGYARYSVPKNKLFITPQSGFVIRGTSPAIGTTYINVVHHSAVGTLTRTTPANSNQNELPLIVSCSTASVETAKGTATVVDVVIPSSELHSPAGQLTPRAEVAGKVVRALLDMDFIINAGYTLPPVIDNYFPHSGDPALPTAITSTMNLTEDEKAEYTVLSLCKLQRQAQIGNKRTWRERVALFTETALYLFDQNMQLKDSFPMADTTAELTGTMGPEDKRSPRLGVHHKARSGGDYLFQERQSSTAAPFAAFRPPDNALPFQLRNRSDSVTPGSKDHITYCAAPTLEIMDCLWELVRVRDSHAAALSTLLGVPAGKSGWLEKENNLRKNFKARYFVLSYGVVEYFKAPVPERGILHWRLQQRIAGPQQHSPVRAPGAAGGFDLIGGSVTKGKATGAFKLQVQDKKGNKVVLQVKSFREQEEWFDALEKHIAYASRHYK